MTKPASHRITIRLTGEEYLELKVRAGDRPLASFLREAALQGVATKRKAAVKAPKADQRSLAQILAVLSQSDALRALKDINALAFDAPQDAEGKIVQAVTDLQTIRALLMLALGVAPR